MDKGDDDGERKRRTVKGTMDRGQGGRRSEERGTVKGTRDSGQGNDGERKGGR